jgi:hypothetical protein
MGIPALAMGLTAGVGAPFGTLGAGCAKGERRTAALPKESIEGVRRERGYRVRESPYPTPPELSSNVRS